MTESSLADPSTAVDWPSDIFRVLKDWDVRQVCHVPDAGHLKLLTQCEDDNDIRTVTLTTEEEGVALLLGAWLGGERGCLLMQSSGVGNTINMLSLAKTCRYPLLMLVTMRGEYGEFNPWQVPMGQATRATMEAMGVIVLDAWEGERVGETVEAAAKLAFNGQAAVAVCLTQRVIGAKDFRALAEPKVGAEPKA